MQKELIQTDKAPQPIGCYSQALRVGTTVYLSGQIPLDPQTGKTIEGDFRSQVEQVFKNIQAVCEAAGGNLNAIVKLTVYLTDMAVFNTVNEVMDVYFQKPYPARTSIAVAALPKNVPVEIEALMVLAT
jgi:reactive intermediate/imine deaminase